MPTMRSVVPHSLPVKSTILVCLEFIHYSLLFLSLNAWCLFAGDTILHVAARAGHEAAAMFLANHGANGSSTNKKVGNYSCKQKGILTKTTLTRMTRNTVTRRNSVPKK